MKSNIEKNSLFPQTFEEFVIEEEWTETELEEGKVPIYKKFYEKAIKILNEIEPFTPKEVKALEGLLPAPFPEECFLASIKYNHMSIETYNECVDLYDEMDKCDGDLFFELGFIVDLFSWTYMTYLNLKQPTLENTEI